MRERDDERAVWFEERRGRLTAVAHRMLGSRGEAEDAVQETWLRFSRADTSGVENLTAWLRTVISRVCLDMLRARGARPEDPAGAWPPERAATAEGPEDEAVLAEAVGLALLVVLDRLGPEERLAFVLHDMFAVPFDRIAPLVDRTPDAAKKLASRARKRVRGTPELPHAELARRRRITEAFLAAARGGDLDGLLAVLAPDVVRRADPAALPVGAPVLLRGAREVAEGTVALAGRARYARPALLNGAVGIVVAPRGTLLLALKLTFEGDLISAYEVIAHPARLAELDIAVLEA